MDPLETDRQGRAWLFTTTEEPSLEQIAAALDSGGPMSELDAATWESELALMDAMAIQFPMPDYFGRNWDALDECVFSESVEGRLIVIRNLASRAEANAARFVDLFEFVWLPEARARTSYPSIWDGRASPRRVALVFTRRQPEPFVATWPNREARTYRAVELHTANGTSRAR
jgi:RNAse (barnase) inhibitor barstar